MVISHGDIERDASLLTPPSRLEAFDHDVVVTGLGMSSM